MHRNVPDELTPQEQLLDRQPVKATPLPTAFVWGTEDPIVGGDVARLHHEETPESQLRLLEGVGHYPMLEAPRRWANAVLDVVSR